MKKSSSPPPSQGQSSQQSRSSFADVKSFTQRTFPCDFKQSVSPHSLDLMFALKYRR